LESSLIDNPPTLLHHHPLIIFVFFLFLLFDFFQNLKVSAPLVARVYPLRVDKDLFDEYSHFLILQTDQHLLKADISGGDIGISECIGVSDVWFYRKGIRSDYAEAYIEELHELTLKPF